MRIGIIFHKNPFGPPVGIDLVRLRAISGGLIRRGIHAEIIAPVNRAGMLEGLIPVRPLAALGRKGNYDLVKTCYHFSMELIGDFHGPVVSRIVRVVDRELPSRDEPFRERLLGCQEMIRGRSAALVLNNAENELRWHRLYGENPPVFLIPTGCPAEIPPSQGNPYPSREPVVLFLGSLAAPRMVEMLNMAARRLKGIFGVHLVGRNKAGMYGGGAESALDPLITDHGEIPQDEVWDYIRHAGIGLALATGIHAFDNDVSKIVNYLRGGLPVLSEEPIINNDLVRETGLGTTFAHGDTDDLVFKARQLLDSPCKDRSAVMEFMAREHSWDARVDNYVALFDKILR